MISVSGAGGRSWTMASRPTGMTSSGRRSSNSARNQRLHSAISLRSGDAVAAGGVFAGEAAADGGHVDRVPEGLLVDAAMLMEPGEQGAARRPGERPALDGFVPARGLADEHRFADGGVARHRRSAHPGAAHAGAHRVNVDGQRRAQNFVTHLWRQRAAPSGRAIDRADGARAAAGR